jgi:hypothetical protein
VIGKEPSFFGRMMLHIDAAWGIPLRLGLGASLPCAEPTPPSPILLANVTMNVTVLGICRIQRHDGALAMTTDRVLAILILLKLTIRVIETQMTPYNTS